MWIHLNYNMYLLQILGMPFVFSRIVRNIDLKYFLLPRFGRSILCLSSGARLEKAEKWTKETVDSRKTGWFNQYYFHKTESIVFPCTHKAKENRRMDRLKRCGIKEKPKLIEQLFYLKFALYNNNFIIRWGCYFLNIIYSKLYVQFVISQIEFLKYVQTL